MFLLPQIAVRPTGEKGEGGFATDVIPGGCVIGDYLGIILPADTNGRQNANGEVYDMWYSDKADICPDPGENGVHLVNTSCEPNCAMAALGRHTVIFALRRIFPGEELTYDYFLGEQEDDCKPGTDNCRCGSAFCRGTLYSNPQVYAAWDAYLGECLRDEPEEPPVPYGEPLPPLDRYPPAIPDNPIHPLFGFREAEPFPCPGTALPPFGSVRALIRETGRRLAFPAIGIVVEGVLYGGHVVMKHAAESAAAAGGTVKYGTPRTSPTFRGARSSRNRRSPSRPHR